MSRGPSVTSNRVAPDASCEFCEDDGGNPPPALVMVSLGLVGERKHLTACESCLRQLQDAIHFALFKFASVASALLLFFVLGCTPLDDGTSSSSSESEGSSSGELGDGASSDDTSGDDDGSSSGASSSSSAGDTGASACGELLDCYFANCFDAFSEWAWCTRQTTPPIPERCAADETGVSPATAELDACFAACGWDGPEGPTHGAARLVLSTCEAVGLDAPSCVDAIDACQGGA
jgi:hypothetical protein